MAIRFGFGFEKRSSISPSTQLAQSSFLKLLPSLKEQVVFSLFQIAFKPFNQFLIDHQAEILQIVKNIEPVPYSRDIAIKMLTFNWSAVESREGAQPLRVALHEWANRWNLPELWCMNHALLTLRERHQASITDRVPDPVGAWQEAIFAGLKCDSIFTQAEFHEEFRQEGLFEFNYKFEKLRFTQEGPFWIPIAEFKRKVANEFKAAGGSVVRGARKALIYQRDVYLNSVNRVAERLNLREPPLRWSEDHFRWLIHYQVPPLMNYREIGRTVKKNEKTVREGIQDVAKLIDLKLRPAHVDRYRGRPKGAKDAAPRRRVDNRRGKVRGNAN